ncbi:hypothetical protein SARC_00240 [Sphaeroforma arctica JP610]|uniref:Uncharacterized protein n=1 Tax=Sphaeroforma arctica JP610 TaxID=667725 RepID=A0A0L0GFQ1_9EUKA|nr:hypothetical protein SARC_00240 [Sphaeroforma arctica JP610]KNC87669.1 hypothetical protein SARC_00240 [Sphaeroforma arctica JP610]|eukprot:XP_014161571.1 hypothetical protein SARC_00240 [Sphaeroforma arctica JP610]
MPVPVFSLLDAYRGRRSLNLTRSDSVEPILSHAGVNYMKRNMLAALGISYEIIPSVEDDKTYITEKQFTTFVNKELKIECGMDGKFKEYTHYHHDAYGVDCKKAYRFDASNKHLYAHVESTGSYLGYTWKEDRYVEADGTLHWVTELDYDGKKTVNHRVFDLGQALD